MEQRNLTSLHEQRVKIGKEQIYNPNVLNFTKRNWMTVRSIFTYVVSIFTMEDIIVGEVFALMFVQ